MLIKKGVQKDLEMDKKVIVKDSWKEVTISEFYEIEEYNIRFSEKKITEIEYIAYILSVLSDLTIDDVMKLPSQSLLKLSENIKFLTEEPKGDIRTNYELSGRKWNLTIYPDKLITAQYIDICNIIKFDNPRIENILAILFTEEGKEYDGTQFKERSKFIADNFNIADARAISAFFLMFSGILTEIMKSYSGNPQEKKGKIQKLKEKLTGVLTKNGHGSI